MRRKGIFVCSSGVRWQNGHWQKSGKGMKSYIWRGDAIDSVLPVIKKLTWNPLQQLNVSGSFDIDVKTFFDTVDEMNRPVTSALFGISTWGIQKTQLEDLASTDTGSLYYHTIGAKGFNMKRSIVVRLPLEPDDDYRQEVYSIERFIRGYSPRGGWSAYNVVTPIKTSYMVTNNIEPKLRYYIKYSKYLAWGKNDNDYSQKIFEEEFETFIPLNITTTQQPFVGGELNPTLCYPIGDVLCMGHNEANAHITYSFTVPAIDSTSYPNMANLFNGHEFDFMICLGTGYATSTDEDWDSKVQLKVSNIT